MRYSTYSVHSRCSPHGRWITQGDPFHRSASNDVVTSIIRSDCYRLERQFAGRVSHPLRDGAFPRHTVRNQEVSCGVAVLLATLPDTAQPLVIVNRARHGLKGENVELEGALFTEWFEWKRWHELPRGWRGPSDDRTALAWLRFAAGSRLNLAQNGH